MPNNRVKTTKALQSKKGKAVLSKLHPHSRRAKQINRIALRDDKLALNKKEKKKQGNALTSRLIWFIEAHKHASGAGSAPANDSINVDQHQHQQPPESTSDDLAHLHTLINRFIARNSAQITHEVSKRKNGQFSNRPKSAAQEKLESLARAEMIEYATNGFVLPDLRTPENLKLLDEWKDSHRCDRSFLARVKLIRLFKDEPARVVEEQRGAIDSFRLTSSGLDGLSDNGQDSQDDDSDEDVQLIEVDS